MRSHRTIPLAMALIVAVNLVLGLLLLPFFRYFPMLIILELLFFALLYRWLFKRSGAFALMEPETVERRCVTRE